MPEAMNAATLVARPTVMSRPRTISSTPAHHAGQAPNATGEPLGNANSFAVPCIANISPTRIRKMPSATPEFDARRVSTVDVERAVEVDMMFDPFGGCTTVAGSIPADGDPVRS